MAIDFKDSISNPMAMDIGNYVTQGRTVSKTIQLASFTTNENASWAATHQLQKESYPFATLSVPVNRNLFRLQVGDCFKFSYEKYGISNMICRILQISEENLESEEITITAMEDIFSVSNSVTRYTAPVIHASEKPTYVLVPFTHQALFEVPYVLSDAIKVLPLACREENLDLGFDLYLSVDGGNSYSFLKRFSNLQPYGTLVGTYPADTYTIDEETGFTINFVDDAELIETTTWANIFSAERNTAILGSEIISFKDIIPVSGEQYKLENVIRGRFGTQKVAHAADEAFWFVRKGIALAAHSEILAGVTRKIKLVPYNIKYAGDISESTAIDLSIDGRSKKPYIPVNFLANGSSKVSRYSADIVLTWSPRYRSKGAGIGTPGVVLADTDREGLFEVGVYVSDVLMRTTTAIDAATWTYTETMNNTDNGSLASEIVFKLLNYRTEEGVLYESDQVEVTCKKN